MLTTAELKTRRMQNDIFGLGRSIKGISNDLKTRHKGRAMDKLDVLINKLYSLAASSEDTIDTIGESLDGSN